MPGHPDPSPAQQHIYAAITAVSDRSISPQAASDKIAEEFVQAVRCEQAKDDESYEGNDTPGVEGVLWGLWGYFLEIAEDDASIHGRLLEILVLLKAKKTDGCEGWRVWGYPMSWENLPVFGLTIREEMDVVPTIDGGVRPPDKESPMVQTLLVGDVPPDAPDAQVYARAWMNLNAFMARLWVGGIMDEAWMAIAMMRDYLEPFSLDPTPEGRGRKRSHVSNGEPPELELETAGVWLRVAGAQMLACRKLFGPKGDPDWTGPEGQPGQTYGGTWDGVDGYHPDRWEHWKGILRAVEQQEWRECVIKSVKETIEAMENFEKAAAVP